MFVTFHISYVFKHTVFQDDIQPEFPDVFTKFIHTARLLSYTALSQVYSRADSICSTGR